MRELAHLIRIATGATGVLLWMAGTVEWDNAAFHLPAAIALVISVWLTTTEWPDVKPAVERRIDNTGPGTAVDAHTAVDTSPKPLTVPDARREGG